jgi:hypothetical protein
MEWVLRGALFLTFSCEKKEEKTRKKRKDKENFIGLLIEYKIS